MEFYGSLYLPIVSSVALPRVAVISHGSIHGSYEPDELMLAIRSVYKGQTLLGPGLFEKALMPIAAPVSSVESRPELAQLTPRELDVLRLIACGANNREIAESLFLSENTVKNYVTNILSRLNLRDRTQAALFAHSLLGGL